MVAGLVDQLAELRVDVWVVYWAEKWVVCLVAETVATMADAKVEPMV